MARYRTKPILIEAEQFLGIIPDPCSLLDDPRIIMKWDGSELLITTWEGVSTAQRGDWIIQGVHGELSSVTPDVFAAMYEAVDSGKEASPCHPLP